VTKGAGWPTTPQKNRNGMRESCLSGLEAALVWQEGAMPWGISPSRGGEKTGVIFRGTCAGESGAWESKVEGTKTLRGTVVGGFPHLVVVRNTSGKGDQE